MDSRRDNFSHFYQKLRGPHGEQFLPIGKQYLYRKVLAARANNRILNQYTYLVNHEQNDQHCKEVSESFNPTTAVNIYKLPDNINIKPKTARVYIIVITIKHSQALR